MFVAQLKYLAECRENPSIIHPGVGEADGERTRSKSMVHGKKHLSPLGRSANRQGLGEDTET